jgi:hypothetical protein
MIEWLAAPIDPLRGHSIAGAVAWHGRFMVVAWGVLFPLGVLVARFGKVTPRQDWPRRLDNKLWWYAHNILQYAGLGVCLVAIWLVARGLPRDRHSALGWLVLLLLAVQVLGGWLRGSKGGPTDRAADGSIHGDHYDMTPRRRAFERVHKSVGYVALLTAVLAILTGLWSANAARWMWLALTGWWVLLGGLAVVWQRQGRTVDTYQAIWGPDPRHPGNRLTPIGWGINRPDPGDGT